MIVSQVRVTDPAIRDLEDIWLYIAEDSPVYATQLVESIRQKFDNLSRYPNMGVECSDFRKRIRILFFKNYSIYYRVLECGNVEVLRVLNSARDVGTSFFH